MPTEILLPAPSADFEAGTIDSWHKSEGDWVEAGDILLDIETDKAVIEVEALHSGVLGKILYPGGAEDVAVNTVVGLLLNDGETADDLEVYASAANDQAEESAPSVETASPLQSEQHLDETPLDGERIFTSPLARRIAAQSNVDLSTLTGRGPNGRILKADVELAVAELDKRPEPAQTPVTPGPAIADEEVQAQNYTAIPNNNMRKVIARRLSESKRDVPHFYLNVDCEIDTLLALRKEVNEQSPEGEGAYKVSVNDFVIKACALAMKDVPAVNASWTEEAVHQYHDVDISVAVATPGGLITPIVRNADRKGLATLSDEVKDLAVRARDGKLKPQEYQGGGFSISNLGMYGIKQFSAIVNPPQSCILAVGAGEQRPVVKNGELAVAAVMSCTLSVDHRTVDGAVAAEFLQVVKRYIENPLSMLLRAG